jgi:hypothetical protein
MLIAFFNVATLADVVLRDNRVKTGCNPGTNPGRDPGASTGLHNPLPQQQIREQDVAGDQKVKPEGWIKKRRQ